MTITELIIKLEQLEWDLAETKKELVKLQVPLMKSLTPEERKAVRLTRSQARKERLRPSIENALGKPDSDVKIPTAEEFQQLLLKEGVRPEDNLGSRAIIEEREKRSECMRQAVNCGRRNISYQLFLSSCSIRRYVLLA